MDGLRRDADACIFVIRAKYSDDGIDHNDLRAYSATNSSKQIILVMLFCASLMIFATKD